MTITPTQFKSLMREVLKDELPQYLRPWSKQIEEMRTSIDGLAKGVKLLTEEFHAQHSRLTRVEKKLDIIPS